MGDNQHEQQERQTENAYASGLEVAGSIIRQHGNLKDAGAVLRERISRERLSIQDDPDGTSYKHRFVRALCKGMELIDEILG